MNKFIFFTFLALIHCCCYYKLNASFINLYPRYKKFIDDDDPGSPLYLTPYIERKEFEEARNAAKVTKPINLMDSYSGYITVNETLKSNMFFWYFPAIMNGPIAPVVLWLQGGPGASSLFGLFMENGPYIIEDVNKVVTLRNYSWNQAHHLIYIDNPVGTGFSFTGVDEGYAKNEKDVGKNLLNCIHQILLLFPELQKLDFYITGESYAGKYVPALAHAIIQENKIKLETKSKPNIKINLQGLAIGNGLVDPLHQLGYSDYLYEIGLIGTQGRDEFKKLEKHGTDCIKKHDMNCAFDVFDQLINMDQLKSGSLFHNLTGYDSYFNYLKTSATLDAPLGAFLQSSEIRKAIHVGNNTFHDLEGENVVEKFLKKDVMDSVAPWLIELLEHYPVYIYNGQLDIIVAYPLTLSYLQRLKFKDHASYRNASRCIWLVDGEIAGYYKSGGNLHEIVIRNAGHMAPADQPKWTHDMISRITNKKKFC